MEVLLLKDVKGLGNRGQVERVADGYARNYLIPRGLAVPASEGARKQAAEQAKAVARREATEQEQAEKLAGKLDGTELVFKVKVGESSRLYGSITSADIAKELTAKVGQEIDKRKIDLDEPIKELGRTSVDVRLYPNVKFSVKVMVESEGESA